MLSDSGSSGSFGAIGSRRSGAVAVVSPSVAVAGATGGMRTSGPSAVGVSGETTGSAGDVVARSGAITDASVAFAASLPAGSVVVFGSGAIRAIGASASGSAGTLLSVGSDVVAVCKGLSGAASLAVSAAMGKVDSGSTTRTVRVSGSGVIGASGASVTAGAWRGAISRSSAGAAICEVGGRESWWSPAMTRIAARIAALIPAMIGVSTGVAWNFGPKADMEANSAAIIDRPKNRLRITPILSAKPAPNTRIATKKTTLAKSAMVTMKARINLFQPHFKQIRASFTTSFISR